MDYEFLEVETKDFIRVIRLNRPEVRNAFNSTMTFELAKCLLESDGDDAVRVVILTGAGKAFSSGADIKEGVGLWEKLKSETGLKRIPDYLVEDFSKPIIAAINGPAIGFGLTITLSCDIRIAAQSALMSMRFTQVGVIPEAGSPFLLPRIVGLANALDLSLTAKTIGADEAYRIGLVNYITPDDQLMDKAMEIAAGIAAKPPAAISIAKRSFYDALDCTFKEQRAMELTNFDKVLGSRDFKDNAEKLTKLAEIFKKPDGK